MSNKPFVIEPVTKADLHEAMLEQRADAQARFDTAQEDVAHAYDRAREADTDATRKAWAMIARKKEAQAEAARVVLELIRRAADAWAGTSKKKHVHQR